jgi:sugar lactone lactonase YvrE
MIPGAAPLNTAVKCFQPINNSWLNLWEKDTLQAKRYFANSLILLMILGAASFMAVAHPGSGIVVDVQGNVYFQDSAARTIWKIDSQGKLTSHSNKLGGHWMALDAKGAFARANLQLVEWLAPALVIADGGAPIAVNQDGNLYYGLDVSRTGQVSVGMTKIFPDGRQELFAPDFAKRIENLGITGLASGSDGTLYVACLTGVWKVKTDGTFTPLVNTVVMKDCDQDAPTPFLRGLDVDTHGTVYAAATGCRGVLKITSDGKIETVLKAERPWSPTGVAVQGDDVYVLEYTHANGHVTEDWLPRVRKLGRDGTVTTLATISKEQQRAQPNRLILPSNRQ